MAQVDTPHFAFPFRFKTGGATTEVVQQDTLDDVIGCAMAILLTHRGQRAELPDFGSPEYAFQQLPIGEEEIQSQIMDQEPRATVIAEEHVAFWDELTDRIVTYIAAREGE